MLNYKSLGLIFIPQNTGLGQITLMIFTSIILFIFLIALEPFAAKFDSILNLISSIFLILVFLICCVFAFFEGDKKYAWTHYYWLHIRITHTRLLSA